jgi:hypothetical protein
MLAARERPLSGPFRRGGDTINRNVNVDALPAAGRHALKRARVADDKGPAMGFPSSTAAAVGQITEWYRP